MDDAEDLLGRLLRVRHFERQRSRLSNGFQKEARRRPGGYPHLARLEHDVALTAAALEGPLRRIGAQVRRPAFACPYPQQGFGQRHGHSAAAQAGRALIQDSAQPFEFFAVHGFKA